MKKLSIALLLAAFSAGAACVASASDTGPALPDGALNATFRYTIGVKAGKSTKSDGGEIVIAPAGGNKLTLTVKANDGTTKTIPLVVENGSVAPATAPAANSPVPPAAQTLMANMKLAASVGAAAKKSGGQSFSVPMTLTPVGEGTPLPMQLSMKPAATSMNVTYSGTVSGTTTTLLPQNNSGGVDPEQVASTGVGVVTGHGIAALAKRHREQTIKQAAQSPVSDAMSLTIQATFANGRFQTIDGAQTDAVTLAGKLEKIYSTWSFTRVP